MVFLPVHKVEKVTQDEKAAQDFYIEQQVTQFFYKKNKRT
ncbi:hypothetical protein C5167_006177 [Papaver somniferum]|uniref:Uncharacterized protein n=1 Tax=Papaver somniferum TaxID=3469 RepID=A0A4Y7JCQ7_PAPSO|nr:hypothetical protein C5167_006177 [Papaver somniferum]